VASEDFQKGAFEGLELRGSFLGHPVSPLLLVFASSVIKSAKLAT
jgi:hypothetical protein